MSACQLTRWEHNRKKNTREYIVLILSSRMFAKMGYKAVSQGETLEIICSGHATKFGPLDVAEPTVSMRFMSPKHFLGVELLHGHQGS